MRTYLLAFVLVGSVLMLSGCGTDEDSFSPTQTEDRGAIEDLIGGDWAAYFAWDVRTDTTSTPGYLSGTPGLSAASDIRWRRIPQERSRDISIHITHSDTGHAVATVEIVDDVAISLFVDGVEDFVKAGVGDTFTRSAVFDRINSIHGPRRGWVLTEISGVNIVSDDATVSIDSVVVEAEGMDPVTIYNVTDLVPRDEVLHLPADTQVTVTVYTGDETDFVYLHVWWWRDEFENMGGGVFQNTWMTPESPGPHHAVIDVLSQDTLEDPEGPYDSRAWGVPYVVEE